MSHIVGNCRAADGSLRTAECFGVQLSSGSRVIDVQVAVIVPALTAIAVDEAAVRLNSYREGNALVRKLVSQFVEEQLSRGGQSYWDPIRFVHHGSSPGFSQEEYGDPRFSIPGLVREEDGRIRSVPADWDGAFFPAIRGDDNELQSGQRPATLSVDTESP
jgi:hypothetical protein